MSGNWYFGQTRENSEIFKELDFLNSLKPGDIFLIEYDTFQKDTNKIKYEYRLMKRTIERYWNNFDGRYEYHNSKINLWNTDNFFQNYFGLDSRKTFESLDDPELNLILNIHFGKNAKDLKILRR